MKLKLFILLLIFSTIIFGQKKQDKVGLILSGGGAKGFAHIGILKEIDKAGVKLDYIGGTSMGAIIGGLYAYGYSANQIEDIILQTDFLAILRDDIPRSSNTFFEKEFGEKTVLTLPADNGKIALPKGISKGQNVLNILLELFGSHVNQQDFSKLPIPFFCIATDVEDGSAVILEDGSLPLALRASASFPTLLNPIEIDHKLLIDGGIANNFPVSILREKEIDFIIGVDVEGKLFEKEKINSVVAVLNQIMSYQMYRKSDEEIKDLDVYIHPDVYKYSVVDFDKKKEIIEAGKIVAKKYRAVFKNIAKKQTIKRKKIPVKINIKKHLISQIGVSGSKNHTKSFVVGKLNIRAGDSLSKQDITKKIHQLQATRNYDVIAYNLKKNKKGGSTLDFNLKESNENATVKLGVHYDQLYKSGVLFNFNQKHFIRENDLFSLDLILGDNLRYILNYFVDNGFHVSYGFRSRYDHFVSNSRYNLVSEDPSLFTINIKYTDITNQIFFQTTFQRKFALGIGLEHKWLKGTTETLSEGNTFTIIENSNYLNSFGYLKIDTYDKKYFVTKGSFADLNFKWFLTSSDYNKNFKMFSQVKGTLGFATSFLNERLTLQNTNEAGFTLGSPISNFFDFYMGGYNQNYINNLVSFYGYGFADLSDDSFVKSQFDIRYRFGQHHYATLIANYARLDNNVFKNIDLFRDVKSGYAIGYSYDSFLGPIELKYSWSPDNKQRYWLFNLGLWF